MKYNKYSIHITQIEEGNCYDCDFSNKTEPDNVICGLPEHICEKLECGNYSHLKIKEIVRKSERKNKTIKFRSKK